MRRHLVNFFPIFIIAGLFLGFGLVKITLAQGGQASPHGPYSPTTDACAGCHRTHNGAGTPILLTDVTNLCNVCHSAIIRPVSVPNPGGAVASSSVALTAISTHGNRDFSERVESPLQLECAQCHDPHSITKLAGLRDYVWLTPAGDIRAGPIVFTATTGLNSFDDGASSPGSRICVSCHANPDNPGYPMVYHVGGDHGNSNYTGQDCTSCHPHDADGDPTTLDGFMPIQGAAPPPTWPVFQSANFQLNEPASSPFVASEANSNLSPAETPEQLRGAVHDPAESLLGDGYFHGDGLDNYIDFENNPTSLQATSSLFIDMRLKPGGIVTDTADYVASIFDRSIAGNYQVSLERMNSWITYDAPLTAASIALWVKPEDTHGGAAWKPVLTDYEFCPIVADHWYQVKIEWDSGKAVGIPGDIYVDDQGLNGDNLGETWSGTINCTNAGQTLLPTESRLYQGDRIQIGAGNYTIGANATDHSRDLYQGLIDWIMINQQPQSTSASNTIYLPLIMNGAASPGGQMQSTTLFIPIILKDERVRP